MLCPLIFYSFCSILYLREHMSFHLYRNRVRWELVEGSFEILVHRGLFWEGVSGMLGRDLGRLFVALEIHNQGLLRG